MKQQLNYFCTSMHKFTHAHNVRNALTINHNLYKSIHVNFKSRYIPILQRTLVNTWSKLARLDGRHFIVSQVQYYKVQQMFYDCECQSTNNFKNCTVAMIVLNILKTIAMFAYLLLWRKSLRLSYKKPD